MQWGKLPMRTLIAAGILCLLLPVTCLSQLPTDDPKEAQKRWYDPVAEREDLTPGAFEVLRFPINYTYQSKYKHDPKNSKFILNPDFYCSECYREGRIAKTDRSGSRLMEQPEEEVLGWISRITKSRPILIEDRQFRLYADLPPLNTRLFKNQFLKEELIELSDIFPKINEKTVGLSSHEVSHLYLIRAHRLLRDLLWMVGNTEEGIKKAYPYLGPYLGMNARQEIYIFARQRSYEEWGTRYIGRTSTDGQCWHLFVDRFMALGMHAQGHEDPQTTNYMFHRLLHNLIDAYRHYGFKLPAWFQEGMGHWVERRESERYNSFCFSEGTIPKVLYASRWLPRVRKMVAKGEVEPFVSMCSLEEYGQLPLEYHTICWSWVCYLWRLGPEKMQIFINELKAKVPAESLYQAQIRAFQKAYGLTLLQFEEGWKAWVLETYPSV
jgi:hypothetical protein